MRRTHEARLGDDAVLARDAGDVLLLQIAADRSGRFAGEQCQRSRAGQYTQLTKTIHF
jgi:hypothetical protein